MYSVVPVHIAKYSVVYSVVPVHIAKFSSLLCDNLRTECDNLRTRSVSLCK